MNLYGQLLFCNYILAGHGLLLAHLTWNEIEAFFSEFHWKASGGESSEFKSTLPQSQVLRSFTIFSSSSSNVLCSLLMEFYNEWDGISINPFLSIEHTNTTTTVLKRHEKPFEMMKSDLKPVWIWWRWFLCWVAVSQLTSSCVSGANLVPASFWLVSFWLFLICCSESRRSACATILLTNWGNQRLFGLVTGAVLSHRAIFSGHC